MKLIFKDGPINGATVERRAGSTSFYLDGAGQHVPLAAGDLRRYGQPTGEGLYQRVLTEIGKHTYLWRAEL